jgi:hypothetical protein
MYWHVSPFESHEYGRCPCLYHRQRPGVLSLTYCPLVLRIRGDIATGCTWDGSGSREHSLVQLFVLEVICVSAGHDITAAVSGLSLRIAIWSVCTIDCILNHH